MIWISHHQSEKLKLSNGDLVEVSSDEEGFKGAWFYARIVKKQGAGYLVDTSAPSKLLTKDAYHTTFSDAQLLQLSQSKLGHNFKA